VDVEVDSLYVKRINIEDLVGYVYIVRVDKVAYRALYVVRVHKIAYRALGNYYHPYI
jgi:hypothetical protein